MAHDIFNISSILSHYVSLYPMMHTISATNRILYISNLSDICSHILLSHDIPISGTAGRGRKTALGSFCEWPRVAACLGPSVALLVAGGHHFWTSAWRWKGVERCIDVLFPLVGWLLEGVATTLNLQQVTDDIWYTKPAPRFLPKVHYCADGRRKVTFFAIW